MSVVDIVSSQFHLETTVSQFTLICPGLCISGDAVNRFLIEQTFRDRVIVVESQPDAIVQQRDIQTEIRLIGLFPLQGPVAQRSGVVGQSGDNRTVALAKDITCRIEQVRISIAFDSIRTRHTVAQSQFQLIQPLRPFFDE